MAHDVFISYSTRDKPVADAVCARLEARKIRCWIAPRDLPPGQTWAGALMEAIDASRVFVLILSNGSNQSSEVLREVGEAADKGIPILPLRIDDVEPSGDIGYYIRRIHWLDALTPPLDRYLQILGDRVQALLDAETDKGPEVAMPEPAPVGPPAGVTSARRQPWPGALMVALMILAVFAGAGGIWWGMSQRQARPSATPIVTIIATSQATAAIPAQAPLLITTPPTAEPTVVTPAIPVDGKVTATTSPWSQLIPPETQSRLVGEPTDLATEFPSATQVVQTAVISTLTPTPTMDATSIAESGQLHILEGHTGHVFDVAWSPDGRIIASGADDGVRLWQADDGSLIHRLELARGRRIAWSPDGQSIAAAGGSVVRLWQIGDGSLVRTLEGHKDSVTALTWSPDGQTIASGGWDLDKTVQLWRVADGRLVQSLTDHAKGLYDVTWSPDGQMLASLSKDGVIKLYRASDLNFVRSISHPPPFLGTTYRIAWSPDSKTLASRSGDIRIWQVGDGTLIRTLQSKWGRCLTGIAWSPDGQTLAISSESNIQLRLARDGSLIRTLEGHADCVTGVAWSPDGQTIASGSWDSTVRLWRVTDN